MVVTSPFGIPKIVVAIASNEILNCMVLGTKLAKLKTILASGYNKKGKHFSKTCELGTMKKQTGKYFSDSSLLARVRYGMQPTEIWDEHTGKTTYYKKTVKNCKIK